MTDPRSAIFARGAEALFGPNPGPRISEEMMVGPEAADAWLTGGAEIPMQALLDLRRLLARAWDYGDPEVRAALAALDELL